MRLYLIAYYTGKMIFGLGPYYNSEDIHTIPQPMAEGLCNMEIKIAVMEFNKSHVNDRDFDPKSLEVKCETMEEIPYIVDNKLYSLDEFHW